MLPVIIAVSTTLTWAFGAIAFVFKRERDEARASERASLERLIQARKDGFEVPEPALPAVPAEPEPQFIPALQALIDEWETPGAKEQQRSVIKRYISQGKSQPEIARLLTPRTEGEGREE